MRRTYTDEELEQTFDRPEEKVKIVKKLVGAEKPKINPKETIAQRKKHQIVKRPVWQSF